MNVRMRRILDLQALPNDPDDDGIEFSTSSVVCG
jgi:hypothetical protein